MIYETLGCSTEKGNGKLLELQRAHVAFSRDILIIFEISLIWNFPSTFDQRSWWNAKMDKIHAMFARYSKMDRRPRGTSYVSRGQVSDVKNERKVRKGKKGRKIERRKKRKERLWRVHCTRARSADGFLIRTIKVRSEGLDHFSNSLTVKHGISVPLSGHAARNVLPVFSPGEDKSVAIPSVTIAPSCLIVS